MDQSKLPKLIKQSQDLINPRKKKSIWGKAAQKRKKTGPISNMKKKRKMLKDADDY
jgi:hypothetical protein